MLIIVMFTIILKQYKQIGFICTLGEFKGLKCQFISFADIDPLEEVMIEDFGEFDGSSILYIALLFDTYYMLYIVLLEDFTDYL